MTLQIGIIPGIQDVPGDWDALKMACSDFADLHHLGRPDFQPTYHNRNNWDASLLHHYEEHIDDVDVLLGHSRGCRTVLKLMERHALQMAVLLNPPRKKSKTPSFPWNKRLNTHAESMLLPLINYLPKHEKDAMLERHVKEAHDEYERMILETKLHRSAPDIAEEIDAVRSSARFLVLESADDPWQAEIVPGDRREAMTMKADGETRGHYDHVVHAEEIADHIRSFTQVDPFTGRSLRASSERKSPSGFRPSEIWQRFFALLPK